MCDWLAFRTIFFPDFLFLMKLAKVGLTSFRRIWDFEVFRVLTRKIRWHRVGWSVDLRLGQARDDHRQVDILLNFHWSCFSSDITFICMWFWLLRFYLHRLRWTSRIGASIRHCSRLASWFISCLLIVWFECALSTLIQSLNCCRDTWWFDLRRRLCAHHWLLWFLSNAFSICWVGEEPYRFLVAWVRLLFFLTFLNSWFGLHILHLRRLALL